MVEFEWDEKKNLSNQKNMELLLKMPFTYRKGQNIK